MLTEFHADIIVGEAVGGAKRGYIGSGRGRSEEGERRTQAEHQVKNGFQQLRCRQKGIVFYSDR